MYKVLYNVNIKRILEAMIDHLVNGHLNDLERVVQPPNSTFYFGKGLSSKILIILIRWFFVFIL